MLKLLHLLLLFYFFYFFYFFEFNLFGVWVSLFLIGNNVYWPLLPSLLLLLSGTVVFLCLMAMACCNVLWYGGVLRNQIC